MMDGEEYIISDDLSLGELPGLNVYQIAVDKQAIKIYVPYGNHKSYYIPTGMQGPSIKLSCKVDNIDGWDVVYTNDYLSVTEMNFPSYNNLLAIGTTWWIDNISGDVKPGYKRSGRLRYDITLDIYKRTVA